MPVAIRAITRLVDADDVNVSLGVGVDEYALVWDNDTARFVLRAPFAGILATGATVGATSQAQAFTNGIVSPFSAPVADSATGWQVRRSDKTTAIVNVDTVSSIVGVLNAGDIQLRLSDLTNSFYFDFGRNTGTGALVIQGNQTGANDIVFAPTSGKVGIGTISPATRLDIDAGALTMKEMGAPTGVANKAMLYTKDSGAGKTQLCCKLGDDVEIVLATQA